MESPSEPAGETRAAPRNALALLVDDGTGVTEAVREALADQPDISLHCCADAYEALNVATQICPTLILQALVLPRMHGLTLVRAYRAHPATRDIPVIVLGTQEDPITRRAAFSIGATDFLSKVPEKLELTARIRYHSCAYLAMQERDNARAALRQSQQLLLENTMQLRRLTHADGLTGLANRPYFDGYVSTQWQSALTNRQPVSLLLIDLDHFRLFNLAYGHMAGDEVLRKVGATIAVCSNRAGDVAARFASEQFAVLLPDTPARGARLIAERIRRSIEGLHIAHPDNAAAPCLTASVGTATLTPDFSNAPLTLMDRADHALEIAKQQGRNRVITH